MRHDSTIGGKAPDYSEQSRVTIEPLKPMNNYDCELDALHRLEWSERIIHDKLHYNYSWDQNDVSPPESPLKSPAKPWSFFTRRQRQRPRTPTPEDEPNRQIHGMIWKPIARRSSYGSTESTSDLQSEHDSLASSPSDDSFLASPPRSRSSSLSSK